MHDTPESVKIAFTRTPISRLIDVDAQTREWSACFAWDLRLREQCYRYDIFVPDNLREALGREIKANTRHLGLLELKLIDAGSHGIEALRTLFTSEGFDAMLWLRGYAARLFPEYAKMLIEQKLEDVNLCVRDRETLEYA